MMRLEQWLNNVIVFAPLVFSRAFLNPRLIVEAFTSAVRFSLACSAGYIFNDLADRDCDRLHPVKLQRRPLAAGTLSIRGALAALAGVCLLLVAGLWGQPAAAPAVLLYLAIMGLYSAGLKRVAWLDILILVVGVLLRLQAGAAPIQVRLSFWMLSTTACLGVFVAALKRRAEYVAIGTQARPSLRGYSLRQLSALAIAGGAASVLFYTWFVCSVRPALLPTLLLAIAGMLRYFRVATRSWLGESPAEAVLSDRPLILILAGWAGASLLILAR